MRNPSMPDKDAIVTIRHFDIRKAWAPQNQSLVSRIAILLMVAVTLTTVVLVAGIDGYPLDRQSTIHLRTPDCMPNFQNLAVVKIKSSETEHAETIVCARVRSSARRHGHREDQDAHECKNTHSSLPIHSDRYLAHGYCLDASTLTVLNVQVGTQWSHRCWRSLT